MKTRNGQTLNANIAKYRLYKVVGERLDLLTEINADTFEYWHRKCNDPIEYKYALVAVNDKNEESSSTYTIVK
jgi:hypothetical protein